MPHLCRASASRGSLARLGQTRRGSDGGVREDGKRVACRAPSGWLSHLAFPPQTCASALTRNSAAVMEAVSLNTGTVMVTRIAKMALTRKAVVSCPRSQALGLEWGRGLRPMAAGQAEGCMDSSQDRCDLRSSFS